MPDLVIKGGTIVTGDGVSVLQHTAISVERQYIADIGSSALVHTANTGKILDASGAVVIPGIINAHAHGCVFGPSMPSGSEPFTVDEVTYFRNRHLLSGTTTLLNVCGLALQNEINPLNNRPSHPLNIAISTAHTQSNIEAARVVDGSGLNHEHLSMTAERMLANGAVALGEVGGGQTLGGGAQEYKFIPKAVRKATGLVISPQLARLLKTAVLGRYLKPGNHVNDRDLAGLLADNGIQHECDLDTLRRAIIQSVMPSVDLALQGFDEVAKISARLGYPAIYHNALPCVSRILRLAREHPRARIIAAHSNHPSFEPAEAVSFARALSELGVTIDISTLDCVSTRWRNGPDNIDALVAARLVHTISTDFAGGHWDSILVAIHRIIRKKLLPPAAAVALATGNVASAFPQLASDRGIIEKGRRADILVVDDRNFANIRHMIIGGSIIIQNGAPLVPLSGSQ